MSSSNFFDFSILEEDDEIDINDIEDVSLDTIKSNMVNYDSKKLCQMVVAYRYLKMNKDLSISAMEELSKRRQAGDNFDFEKFIQESLDELPVIDFSMPDLRTLLNNFSVKK